jgi:glyoxylase-like metal-dependent hydrolase (beta-lactamase superfamily II)
MHFIPLKGHTRGHSGVALRLDDGWLLHCGDAYTFHGSVHPRKPFEPPNSRLWRPLVNLVRPFRMVGIHSSRLRLLQREHGDEIALTCTHDPFEYYKFTRNEAL